MSKTRIEWTGNIQVHHPVKEAEVIPLDTEAFWDRVLQQIEAESPRRPLETGLAA